jgi:hypothetical protein
MVGFPSSSTSETLDADEETVRPNWLRVWPASMAAAAKSEPVGTGDRWPGEGDLTLAAVAAGPNIISNGANPIPMPPRPMPRGGPRSPRLGKILASFPSEVELELLLLLLLLSSSAGACSKSLGLLFLPRRWS